MQRTINTLIASSPVWTSTLICQGCHRVGVSIFLGSMSSGIATYSTPVNSTFSGIITLQRQLAGDDEYQWRDVQEWSVTAATSKTVQREVIRDPEVETCAYRLGVKEGLFYAVGFAYARLGVT